MAHLGITRIVTVCGIITSFYTGAYPLELETWPKESITCDIFQLAETCTMTSTTEISPEKDTNTENATLNEISLYYVNLARNLYVYITPFIVIFGVPGNILSFIIMTRKHNGDISCCVAAHQ